MQQQEYISIGKLGKAHGLSGAVKANIEDRFLEDLADKGVCFLELSGQKVPYFIDGIQDGNQLILSFEGVSSREQAMLLQSKEILMRLQDIHPENLESEEGLVYAFCTGFCIYDPEGKAIGIIEEVLDMPQQEMALLNNEGKEVFIPLHPDWIIEIDEDKQQVLMDLPDGLLD